MKGFEIKNAYQDDIPALALLLGRLFRMEKDFNASVKAQERGLALVLASPQAVLKTAWYDQRLIGMASGQLVVSTSEGAPSAWIEDVIVEDEFRGQGVGSLLLGSLEAWAAEKGATRLQLVADLDNARALKFYKGRGWKPTNLTVVKKKL